MLGEHQHAGEPTVPLSRHRTAIEGTRVAGAAWKNASLSCLALMCKMFTLLKSCNILYTLKSYFMSYLIRSDLL